ncbi:MAG: hypothetical protein GF388_01540 [Candidatus Aegiribacteria sp.]|nr:hypothetical protein [Candidatus Aegiribacteria sp.]MBD3294057.1 hypothetical protein [Candidatus Fermentibacteria bacterium]
MYLSDLIPARKGWVLALTENGRWLLKTGTASDLRLEPGISMQEEELRLAARTDQVPAAKNDCRRYLSRFDRTESQLKSYLVKRDYLETVADSVTEWAAGNGLVDDGRFASVYIRSHSGSDPLGNFKIRRELRKRGVAPGIIDELLCERNEEDYLDVLVANVSSRYGNLQPRRAYRRASSYLARRGFNRDIIRRVLNEALNGFWGD